MNWNASVREIKERDHQQRLVFIWSQCFLGNSSWELWSFRRGFFMRFVKPELKIVRLALGADIQFLSSFLCLFFSLLALLSNPLSYKATRVWPQPEMLWQSLQSMRFYFFFHGITCQKIWHILKRYLGHLKSQCFTWEYCKDSLSDLIEICFRTGMIEAMAWKMSLGGEQTWKSLSSMCQERWTMDEHRLSPAGRTPLE